MVATIKKEAKATSALEKMVYEWLDGIWVTKRWYNDMTTTVGHDVDSMLADLNIPVWLVDISRIQRTINRMSHQQEKNGRKHHELNGRHDTMIEIVEIVLKE